MQKERNLEVIQDEYNNVIIKKPAFSGEEHRRPIIFQGHIDMVYVKTEDSDHCYEDGIGVLDNGEFLYAKDTTLGQITELQFAMLDAFGQQRYQEPAVGIHFYGG